MKTLLSHPTIPLLLIGCWLFCAGCGSTAPARFYMLSPVSESSRPADIDITRGRTFSGSVLSPCHCTSIARRS